MPELPTGTVTFLFTDIEGSTRLLQALGRTRYQQLQDAHARIVRRAMAEHAGVEIRTEGDSFFVVFPPRTTRFARPWRRSEGWPRTGGAMAETSGSASASTPAKAPSEGTTTWAST